MLGTRLSNTMYESVDSNSVHDSIVRVRHLRTCHFRLKHASYVMHVSLRCSTHALNALCERELRARQLGQVGHH
jgi:hypothetical protein